MNELFHVKLNERNVLALYFYLFVCIQKLMSWIKDGNLREKLGLQVANDQKANTTLQKKRKELFL